MDEHYPLLDIVLDSRPPSKNARTRFNRVTGGIYTEPTVRGWMDDVIIQVRRAKTRSWMPDEDVSLVVEIVVVRGLHKFDLDGALPVLVDAIMAGLIAPTMECRAPDQWVTHIQASKRLGDKDATQCKVCSDERRATRQEDYQRKKRGQS